eukprot:GFKZ01014230.1.p1 GENE.GFKZ01014230.1~~GFKZ01014230.1.p1  ORF type:complete len:818 (-),score=109.07 GFKZ01014230.1:893-3346(-)
MATPGRSRTVRQSSDAAALRTQPRSATMTYSFAQQMPALPPRPSQPPPRPASEDPNFPHLSRPHSPHPTQQLWVSPPGKPTTAAEIVAARRPEATPDEEETHESAKQQAELALYSKLVPTTSAVPRNPGRPLGGGGLRATGSVAAPKSRIATPTSKSSLAQRKEPMASRMRSLSSEASRPQLARKIAQSSRAASATPPPAEKDQNGLKNGIYTDEGSVQNQHVKSESHVNGSVEHQELQDMTRLSLDVKATVIAPKPRDVRTDIREAYLKSIGSVNGHVDKETLKPASRTEQSAIATSRHRVGGESRQTGGEPISMRRQKNPPTHARRLEEAFANGGRRDGVRSPSPMAVGKGRVGGLRRPTASSPPPINSLPRKVGGRDQPLAKPKNGTKLSLKEPSSDAPPGFGGRLSTASKAKYVPRRSDDGANGLKQVERDNVPALPQNDRADAFREAINTRRHSSSPRPFTPRRGTGNESVQNGSQQPNSIRSVEKDNSRVSNGSKGQSRHSSFPSKPNGTLGNVSVEQRVTLQRSVDQGHAKGRRQENGLERGEDRSTELLHPSLSDTASQVKLCEEGSRVPASKISTQHSVNGLSSRTVIEDAGHRGDHVDVTHLMPSVLSNHNLGIHPTLSAIGPLSIAGSDEDLNRSPTEQIAVAKTDFAHQSVNGWSLGRNEIPCGRPESLIDGLLSQEDDHVPGISAGLVNGSLPSSSAAGLSMIDLMRELEVNGSTTSALLNEGCEDVLLPPLPDSEEDVRFEHMLRSMGWTPPDEDENSRGNGLGIMQETTPRVLQARVEEEMNGGMQRVKNGNGQSPYYSHFQ